MISRTTSSTVNQNVGKPQYYIVFIFGSFGFGAILRILLRKWANLIGDWKWGSLIKLPYTVFLLLSGMVLSAIGLHFPNEVQPYLLGEMDPELFLHIFLPVVIFESAYVIDIHVFWRSIGHVSLLAVPGLLMSTVLTACLSLVLPEIGGIQNFQAKIYIALIFGAIISATDPVAVVSLLKDLGSQKYLGTIIEGEALLNDGAAIVVFKIFIELLKSMTTHFESQTALSTFQLVIQQSLLGPVIGWILAKIASFTLQNIYNDALAEITVTLSFTYITFYVGEVCKTSGVLAVVTFGLATDRTSITPQVDHFLHRFWEMLAYLANTLIFVIVGVLITKQIDNINIHDVGYLLIIYIGITIIRAVSIFTFFPAMKRLGLDLNWRHVLIMTWGGLRGAVGLALAIYLSSHAALFSSLQLFSNVRSNNQQNASSGISIDSIFQKMLMHTGGIVVLTLVINASTIEAVLKKLGMLDITHAQQMTMHNAVHQIQDNVKHSVGILKYDRFLADAKWNLVEELTKVDYPYKDLEEEKSQQVFKTEKSITAIQIYHSQDVSASSDLFEEARLRLIKALKMSYGKQYTTGILSDQETRVLVAAADKAADKTGEFINIDNIRKNWQITGLLPFVKGKLEDWMYSRKSNNLIPPGNRQRRKLFRLVISSKFEMFMQCVIIINIIPITLDFVVLETWNEADTWWLALQIVNIMFIVVYCGEVALKVIGLGRKQFIRSRWNQFDVLILIISFIELTIDFTLIGTSPGKGSIVKTVKTTKVIKFGKVTKVIRTLRATRLLRLSKTIMPRMVDIINKFINKRLSFGYNVGKGFVTAEEEVSKLIVSISENKVIQRKLKQVSHQSRLAVTKDMGLLQRDHPGIAISVKTRNAIRIILNNSKDAIHQLSAGGVLDETEVQLLERGVELRQKQLSKFPSTVAPPPPEDLLENMFWIKGNVKLLDFIKEHAICMDYDYGDIIIEENDVPDGIHIIIFGMVKLHGSLHGHIQQLPFHATSNESIFTNKKSFLEQEQEDFLGSGNVIGELSLLTKSKQTCTITCETAVQTYFLGTEDIEDAFFMYPELKMMMWKILAVRITVPLYLEHFEYQGISVARIHLHLSQGYIIELDHTNSTFYFTENILEASLIHGTVLAQSSDDILESPLLIHSDERKLQVHNCKLVVLLVIPREQIALDKVTSGLGFVHQRAKRLSSLSKNSVTKVFQKKRNKFIPAGEHSEIEE